MNKALETTIEAILMGILAITVVVTLLTVFQAMWKQFEEIMADETRDFRKQIDNLLDILDTEDIAFVQETAKQIGVEISEKGVSIPIKIIDCADPAKLGRLLSSLIHDLNNGYKVKMIGSLVKMVHGKYSNGYISAMSSGFRHENEKALFLEEVKQLSRDAEKAKKEDLVKGVRANLDLKDSE